MGGFLRPRFRESNDREVETSATYHPFFGNLANCTEFTGVITKSQQMKNEPFAMINFASPSTNSTNNSGKWPYPYIVYYQQ